MTTRVHGEKAASAAADVSALLFGRGDAAALSADAIEALKREVPFKVISAPSNSPIETFDTFVKAELVPSRGAARRLLEQGGLYSNNRKLGLNDPVLDEHEMLDGRYLLLRKGAREQCLVQFVD
ncbi:MAG: hypothetical protein JJD97_09450 [Gemmatimonadaceae bacterium]|nr:hypothetical protein [Gemmatimonadaceae bacterium]